jgi:hypothetical protein
MALPRFRVRAVTLALVLSLGLIAGPLGAGEAAAATCKSRGQAVIKQRQLTIYFVQTATGSEYRGCDVPTGRVTRLVTKGQSYATEQIAAHGRHATVVEAIDPFGAGPTQKRVVTIWDLRRGRVFTALEIDTEPERSRPVPQLVDSPEGDPVTAVSYLTGGKRVLDVVSNKGSRRLSDGGVKPGSVKVSERTVRWVEGTKRRSRKV